MEITSVADMERRLSELETAVWEIPTLIDLRLGRVDSSYAEVAGRLSRLEKTMTTMQIDMRDLRGGVTRQLSAQDAHLRGIDKRLEGLEERLGAVEVHIGALDERVGALEARIGAVEERLGSVEERLGAVDRHLGAVDERLGVVRERLDTIDNRLGGMEGLLVRILERVERPQA